jgi:hypothetical protein
MVKRKVSSKQTQYMKKHAKKQWLGFWIVLIMFLSVLIAALVFLFYS